MMGFTPCIYNNWATTAPMFEQRETINTVYIISRITACKCNPGKLLKIVGGKAGSTTRTINPNPYQFSLPHFLPQASIGTPSSAEDLKGCPSNTITPGKGIFAWLNGRARFKFDGISLQSSLFFLPTAAKVTLEPAFRPSPV